MERFRSLNPKEVARGYAKTVVETTLFNAAQLSIGYAIDSLGIPLGRAMSKAPYVPRVRRSNVSIFFDEVIQTPFVEEAVFRLIPSVMLNRLTDNNKAHTGVGILTATVFAALHARAPDEKRKMRFSGEAIPLPQFAGGLMNWRLIRNRGFSHAVLAHGLVNAELSLLEKAIDVLRKPRKIDRLRKST